MEGNQIEKKDDAKPVEMEKKSKKRKKIMTNNLLNVDGGDSSRKAVDDHLTEPKIDFAVNEKGDAALPHLREKGNMGNDDNLGKTGESESTERNSNSMSNEKAQIEGKGKGPLDEPDCELESRKKKRKHEVHQKEIGNENVSTPVEINEGENVVSGESNVKSTVKRRDIEDSQGGKLKKVIDNSSEEPGSSGKSKKVSFSGQVKIFPTKDIENMRWKSEADGLVRGKRFTPEEDEIVKEAVLNYIKERDLGQEGLTKLMNSRCHREELKNCWKEIGCCIPYRPYVAVYYRAHVLFERAEKREWTEEETEYIQKSYEKHGNNWKKVAEELGKHRIHVKDKWRRIQNRKINSNKGKWTQEEYQRLYDLVNVNFQTKMFREEKKSKHGMLRDGIPWGTVSEKLETRSDINCYNKWYGQLTSSLVAEDKWSNADDYRLISALYDLDAACVEDLDWDALLEHRPGDICKKRWNQMVLHIGHHGSSPFSEQVEVLSKRYCPDLAEVREAWDNKPSVP